uniref:Putative DNA-3-methyladenine glycosylase III n=1 Tax=Magnetococcus massalia (strain MO-1) TaxID=451514 RepID=A0A1S7LD36_MAGMO|nr:Putative DNA-3-methyladenine glycosylase III [Candidatus Magnetococcus massalia]
MTTPQQQKRKAKQQAALKAALQAAEPWPVRMVYDHMQAHYGLQGWWPAESSFEMMLGAMLVQNTTWIGATRAIEALQHAGLDNPEGLRTAPDEAIEACIRPAGYFRQKRKRLQALAWFLADYQDSCQLLFEMEGEGLRERLLGVYGVGEETADSICCYEAKQPRFIVDSYTQRFFQRLGWLEAKWPYSHLQQAVEGKLPADSELLGQFHGLIVHHCKVHCMAKPQCRGCPLSFCCASSPDGAPMDLV